MDEPEKINPDWKDFLALVIASYQLILPIVLLIILSAVLVVLALAHFMR